MSAKRGAGRITHPDLRRAKIAQAMEFRLRGLTRADTANLMGVGLKTIEKWTTEARQTGIIEEVRDKLSSMTLPKAIRTYDEILDASPDELTKKGTVKAHELKLKAARDIAQGLGALRTGRDAVKIKQTVDLEGYYQLREARRLTTTPPDQLTEGEKARLEARGDVNDVVEADFSVEDTHGTTRERGFSAPRAADQRENGRGGLRSDDRDDPRPDVEGVDAGGGGESRHDGGRDALSDPPARPGVELDGGGTREVGEE